MKRTRAPLTVSYAAEPAPMAPPPEPAAYRRWYVWLVLGIWLVHWLSSWNKPPHIALTR